MPKRKRSKNRRYIVIGLAVALLVLGVWLLDQFTGQPYTLNLAPKATFTLIEDKSGIPLAGQSVRFESHDKRGYKCDTETLTPIGCRPYELRVHSTVTDTKGRFSVPAPYLQENNEVWLDNYHGFGGWDRVARFNEHGDRATVDDPVYVEVMTIP